MPLLEEREWGRAGDFPADEPEWVSGFTLSHERD
jgi:hypothetical protein